jgi:SpoVK/Ycf46/Vps4 family AAA+-type ATPase
MGKKVKLISTIPLVEDVAFELNDWHISAKNNEGQTVIYNFKVEEQEESFEKEYKIIPGSYRITPKAGLQPISFSNSKYYETATSKKLLNKFRVFQKNIHVYEELGISKKTRSLLLASEPGVGKSSLINYFSYNLQQLTENAKSCILFIDNEAVDFEVVQKMFKTAKKEDVDFIVLVIEDIGGSGLNERRNSVDSTLLNFLDGQDGVFKIPTLIVGTTNYLDDLGQALRRPGRFDDVIEVDLPSDEECIQITTDYIKRELSESEKNAIKGKKLNPAYLKEAVVRHKLEDISLEESMEQLAKQKEKNDTNTMSQKNRKAPMGFSDWD